MKVLNTGKIIFKCECCGSTLEAEVKDCFEKHTMPPTFEARCANCHQITDISSCSHGFKALTYKAVVSIYPHLFK